MVALNELVSYTNDLLQADRFNDYCPNGLQVEGRPAVSTIVSGVTASMALLEAAHAGGADAVLVHHGYFWKGEDACVHGMKRARLRQLLTTDTSLLAWHLPLDAHPELGNNAQLARVLDLRQTGAFGDDGGMNLACAGEVDEPVSPGELHARLERVLGRSPQHIDGRASVIKRVGWCTGAAQSYLEAAAAQGLDAFISGEISEQTVHVARECGIHYFAAGHHATERYGVQALGEHLAKQFGLTHRFIDVDNPV
ncbi:MAG: Nif3-like dinuclear metal center hexameric protein [Gammaproteobacteria bacterium]|nr:Nif3-like dinuclear metal center hexameric protein [Gammaproteobacteria bacterium]